MHHKRPSVITRRTCGRTDNLSLQVRAGYGVLNERVWSEWGDSIQVQTLPRRVPTLLRMKDLAKLCFIPSFPCTLGIQLVVLGVSMFVTYQDFPRYDR